jgi:predicted DNA-binding transcriptional regulator AlpA
MVRKKNPKTETAPATALIHVTPQRARWAKAGDLAKHIGVSKMTLWRFRNDNALRFPNPSVVGGIALFDVDEVDQWMAAHRAAK